MRQYITNTGSGACVRNQHAVVAKDNGAILVVEGGGGYGQVIAKEAMDVGIKRAKEKVVVGGQPGDTRSNSDPMQHVVDHRHHCES